MPIGRDASELAFNIYVYDLSKCMFNYSCFLLNMGFCLIPNTFPTNLCHSFEFLCSDLGLSCWTLSFAVQVYVQNKV